jgi:hypothetical protein
MDRRLPQTKRSENSYEAEGLTRIRKVCYTTANIRNYELQKMIERNESALPEVLVKAREKARLTVRAIAALYEKNMRTT